MVGASTRFEENGLGGLYRNCTGQYSFGPVLTKLHQNCTGKLYRNCTGQYSFGTVLTKLYQNCTCLLYQNLQVNCTETVLASNTRQSMCIHVRPCLSMSFHVQPHPSMSVNVHPYLSMSIHVHPCRDSRFPPYSYPRYSAAEAKIHMFPMLFDLPAELGSCKIGRGSNNTHISAAF